MRKNERSLIMQELEGQVEIGCGSKQANKKNVACTNVFRVKLLGTVIFELVFRLILLCNHKVDNKYEHL